MKRIFVAMLVVLGISIGVSCALNTSETEQALCTIEDQASGNCPGMEGCIPMDSCVDADVQSGNCCYKFNYPKSITSYSVTCGDAPDGTPQCIRNNTYDFGVVAIHCKTVTYWVTGPDGNVRQQSYTDCWVVQ